MFSHELPIPCHDVLPIKYFIRYSFILFTFSKSSTKGHLDSRLQWSNGDFSIVSEYDLYERK